MSFVEIKSRSADTLISVHQHIDNGGHTICVDENSGITVETGFFGYSETKVYLSSVDIDSLISSLQEAKRRLNENNLVTRLKGE